MKPSLGLEIKVGLLVILGFVGTMVMIMLADKLSFEHYYQISVYLDDAGGLRDGSPVTLSGITIGNVSAIEHAEDARGAILVHARIKSHEGIPRNATLALSSSGIFGDSYLAFESHGPSGGYLATDGSAAVTASPGFLSQASAEAKGILHNVAGLLDQSSSQDIRRLIHRAADLASAGADVAKTLADQDKRIASMLDDLHAVAGDLRAATKDLSARVGTLSDHLDATLTGANGHLKDVNEHLDATLAKVDGLVDSASAIVSGRHQDIDLLIHQMAMAATHAAAVLRAVDSGQGVLGRLVFSRDLAHEVDALAADLTVAAQILSQHPSSLVWGESSKEKAQAEQERNHLLMQGAFHQDFGEHPDQAAPPPSAAPAAPPAPRTAANGSADTSAR